jgi:hypothetical protein
MSKDKMHITHSQKNVIRETDKFKTWNYPWNYNFYYNFPAPENYIVAEAGGPQIAENGMMYFVGSFIAHIYRKGNYRFECEFNRDKVNVTCRKI